AIVREPLVFLFDEPLSNLDAKLRVTMRLEIRRLHNRLKATSIFVTHDQVEAMTLADQVVVMNAGRIEQIGKPTDVYRNPASKFVATFIGSPAMNLAKGRVTEPGRVEIGSGTLAYDPKIFKAQAGQPVDVGVRPEDLRFAGGTGHGLPFAADMVEELGATRLVHGLSSGAPIVIAIPTGTPEATDKTHLMAASDAVHLFDPESGQSLRA
ncbi:MAG: hypothetical protein RL291_1238, partial [Pseudomonadota bacterium]